MVKKRIPYLVEDVSRHGQVRLYYRRGGTKIRIWVSVEDPEFFFAWQAATQGQQLPRPAKAAVHDTRPSKGTFAALCDLYFQSAPFGALRKVSQRNRRGILRHCCAEETKPGSGVKIGDVPVMTFGAAHVRLLRDRKAGLPEAANNRVKAIRSLFAWAQEGEEDARNPTKGIKLFRGKPEGFHSWTLAEVAQFERRHPVGTIPRLAFDLALYTSQRRSDVVRLGPEHVEIVEDAETGEAVAWLVFRQQKTGAKVELPIIENLAESIAARPIAGSTFLMTSFGKAFTADGLGIRFRQWCDEASLPQCAIHGLRKATASRLAELGCSEEEIGAITGHANGKELARYTKAARRRLMAGNAMARMAASLQSNRPTKLAEDAKSGTVLEGKV